MGSSKLATVIPKSDMFVAIDVRITTLSSTISNNPKPTNDSSATNSYMKRSHFAVDKIFIYIYMQSLKCFIFRFDIKNINRVRKLFFFNYIALSWERDLYYFTFLAFLQQRQEMPPDFFER